MSINIVIQRGRLGINKRRNWAAAFITISEGLYSRTGRLDGNVDEGRGVQVEAWLPANEHGDRRVVFAATLFGKEVFNENARNKLGGTGAFEQLPVSQEDIDALVWAAKAAIITEYTPKVEMN